MQKIFITILLLAISSPQPPTGEALHNCSAEESAMENAGDVLIGYFGPDDANNPDAGDMWCSAVLALEKANERGGYRGRPFRLISGWSENPWGSGVKDVTRMAYHHNVYAIIGGIDGPSTHLAEQVVAKARLALLSGANADRTANLANVPWMFSTLPGHHLQARALAGAVELIVKKDNFIMLSSVDHDSHLLAVELARCFRKRKLSPRFHFEFKSKQSQDSELLERILNSHAAAVVITAPLTETAHLVNNLRNKGYRGTIFGGPSMSTRRFITTAGNNAEAVVFPLLCENTERMADFETDFFKRFARDADYLSAHTYDTVNILIEAVHRAGLDREKIRNEIEKMSPWNGVTGSVCWDKQGSNTRAVRIGTISNGRVKILNCDKDNTLTASSTGLQ